MHSAYVLSPSGVPLGFLYEKIWARESTAGKKKQANSSRPIEAKESFKWLETLTAVSARLRAFDTEVIHIADREADIYELFCEAQRSDDLFIIRANCSRVVNRQNRKADSGQALQDLLVSQKSLGTLIFTLPSRQGRRQREVTVELRSAIADLSPPYDKRASKDNYTETIKIAAILVTEVNPPDGEERLEWILFTNLKMASFDDILTIVKWYSFRWRIEEFHRILKSGCKAEDCRLQTAEKLIKYFSLLMVIAWRIHWLTKISREAPDTPCNIVFNEAEWKGLCVIVLKNSRLLKKPPTINQAIRAIAGLGGFLGRKGDKEPGPETIWQGLQALFHIAESWKAMS